MSEWKFWKETDFGEIWACSEKEWWVYTFLVGDTEPGGLTWYWTPYSPSRETAKPIGRLEVLILTGTTGPKETEQ